MSKTDTVSTMFLMICCLQQRGAGGVVEANGVVLAGGDEEVVLAVEVEAVYLPGVVGEDRADGHAADRAVVQLRQRGRHPPLERAAAAAARPPDFWISCFRALE